MPSERRAKVSRFQWFEVRTRGRRQFDPSGSFHCTHTLLSLCKCLCARPPLLLLRCFLPSFISDAPPPARPLLVSAIHSWPSTRERVFRVANRNRTRRSNRGRKLQLFLLLAPKSSPSLRTRGTREEKQRTRSFPPPACCSAPLLLLLPMPCANTLLPFSQLSRIDCRTLDNVVCRRHGLAAASPPKRKRIIRCARRRLLFVRRMCFGLDECAF